MPFPLDIVSEMGRFSLLRSSRCSPCRNAHNRSLVRIGEEMLLCLGMVLKRDNPLKEGDISGELLFCEPSAPYKVEL